MYMYINLLFKQPLKYTRRLQQQSNVSQLNGCWPIKGAYKVANCIVFPADVLSRSGVEKVQWRTYIILSCHSLKPSITRHFLFEVDFILYICSFCKPGFSWRIKIFRHYNPNICYFLDKFSQQILNIFTDQFHGDLIQNNRQATKVHNISQFC